MILSESVILLLSASTAFSLPSPNFINAIANKLANGKSSAVGGATSTNQVIDLTLLKRNALYSSVSYCPPEQIQNWSCIRCQGQPAIQGTNTTSVLTSPKSIDVQGFVAVNPSQKLIIVSFRGSVSPQNFGLDISGALIPPLPSQLFPNNQDAKIHTGFQAAYGALRSQMQSALLTLTQQNPSFEILFCGHSLGASMASIAAVDYKLNLNPSADPSKIILSTIGEPRTGNTGFSALLASLNFNAVQRAVNQRDSIPHFPATIAGFHHRSTEIWTNPNDGNTYLCDDADQGESSNCANTIDVFSLDGNDHLNYFGFKIGSDACLTS